MFHLCSQYCRFLLSETSETTMADSQPKADLADRFKTGNVYLFVPNLIGYVRVFLALLSFWFMPTNCVAAGVCYLVPFLEAVLC